MEIALEYNPRSCIKLLCCWIHKPKNQFYIQFNFIISNDLTFSLIQQNPIAFDFENVQANGILLIIFSIMPLSKE